MSYDRTNEDYEARVAADARDGHYLTESKSMKPTISNIKLVFDVESIGLHGEPYAVAFVVTDESGRELDAARFAIPSVYAHGSDDDREWCNENIPPISITHMSMDDMLNAFWHQWMLWKAKGAQMFAECAWPVEAKFLAMCIGRNYPASKWDGPYPLHEIASFMAAAGMDPMVSYPYEEGETKHDPLSDARQSARLLQAALKILNQSKEEPTTATFGSPDRIFTAVETI